MRRFAYVIAVSVCLVAGCAESPVEPRAAAPAEHSADIRTDTTQVPPPANTRDNGVGMGSGT